jgi:uncharacterized protein
MVETEPERRSTAEEISVAFTRVLRGAGLVVPIDAVLAFTEALDAVGMSQRRNVYWAARATLVRRPEDFGVFERAFKVFFDGRRPSGDDEPEPEPLHITIVVG